MKALIFNSGRGSRMGKLTEQCPKCLLKLSSGETILGRQLRILAGCGITEAVITTGAYEADILAEAQKQSGITVQSVPNPRYDSTNYIYSMHLAHPFLDDDVLMLHGDLVFSQDLVQAMLDDARADLCLIHPDVPQPPKDFKGRIADGCLQAVSVELSDAQSFALQPMYKLSRSTMAAWLARVQEFVQAGRTDVYAEEALDAVTGAHRIEPLSYAPYFISEIDTPDDYAAVSRQIARYDEGVRFSLSAISVLLAKYGAKRPFFVMGRHLQGSDVHKLLTSLGVDAGYDFSVQENPSDESTARTLEAFLAHRGDLLVSIGGGSAMDTAKTVKYRLLEAQDAAKLVHIAVPTTAGSGSEATQFAVIYQGGVKCSLEHPALLPEHCILDSRLLHSLSPQQRKVSLLDAICHSTESLLSRHATPESRQCAVLSLQALLADCVAFAEGEQSVYDRMLLAAHDAGRAIQQTRTTFAHAMSYVLTAEYGIQHGQAAMLCLMHGLRYVEQNGMAALEEVRQALGCRAEETASARLFAIYRRMQPAERPWLQGADPAVLAGKVNAQRLSNSVIAFSQTDLQLIYASVADVYDGK
ncbi:MAG: iron-containing alcohol dehydrogenase [Oscillospiraceae bacterium]|nr:iron-containing alcohol dehydrogenase [Oscillospiraceae bacterium]